jgi:hypothetical protein
VADVTGPFLPLIPNWISGCVGSYEFRTEIIQSRSGSEQRIAWRQYPRRQIEFSAWAPQHVYRELAQRLRRPTAERPLLPDPTEDSTQVETSFGSGATVFRVIDVPRWLVPGARLVFCSPQRVECVTVADVVGVSITLESATVEGWPAGTVVLPAVAADLAEVLQTEVATPNLVTGSVSAALAPGENAADLFGSPGHTHDGREVALFRPNLVSLPSIQFEQPVELLDVTLGRVGRYAPIALAPRTMQFVFTARRRAEVVDLVRFFCRQRGRRGEFYAPTWMDDLRPIAVGPDSFTSGDKYVGANYGNLSEYSAVAICTKRFGVVTRRVTSIVDTPGGSVVTISGSMPGVPPSEIEMISWLPLVRFASDVLAVDWQTSKFANVTVSLTALPTQADLGGEDALDRGAGWFYSEFGDNIDWVFTDPFDRFINVEYPRIMRDATEFGYGWDRYVGEPLGRFVNVEYPRIMENY